jgi:RNA polymerase-binding transcription factor DksA
MTAVQSAPTQPVRSLDSGTPSRQLLIELLREEQAKRWDALRDGPPNSPAMEQLAQQAKASRVKAAEITAALERLNSGTYGACEACSAMIPEARLEALPYARMCVSCKSARDAASSFR